MAGPLREFQGAKQQLEDSQVTMRDAEADKQKALSDPLQGAQQAVRKGGPLRDHGDKKVEDVVFAEDERSRVRPAKQVVDHGACRGNRPA